MQTNNAYGEILQGMQISYFYKFLLILEFINDIYLQQLLLLDSNGDILFPFFVCFGTRA